MKVVSILGCGWLGFPLSQLFLKNNYLVKGSTTSPDKLNFLQESGITPYLIKVNENSVSGFSNEFFSSQHLIINFPPGRSEEKASVFYQQMKNLINELKNNNHQPNILFISSTSVYPSNSGVTKEDCQLKPDKESGKALLEVENNLFTEFPRVTSLRLAGLIGYDRVPARFLSGKTNLKSGMAPVNLVHRDDCIAIIFQIVNENRFGKIYNVCSDLHPTRKEYYIKAAQKANITLPEFIEEEMDSSAKWIDNSLLKSELNYTYLYPDPELI